MRVLILSGIFPPDIGGPATHATDVRTELTARGHAVDVLTLWDRPRMRTTNGVVCLPRGWPWPARMLTALGWIVRNRGRFDVIYATGLGPVAVAGGRCTRLPVVLKIVGDPAWERSVRRGLTDEDFDRFQATSDGGLVVRAMREIRNWSARDATRVITPSPHLADVVKRWADRDDVAVIPNGVRSFTFSAPDRGRGSGLQLVFVGRLVGHKNVDVLIEAVARTPASRLLVIGDGPELGALTKLVEQLGATERIVLTGALPHAAAMEQLALGDALVLASGYEGLPHVVLEALVAGVPVITVATHGLDEVITHDVDGVVVGSATPSAFSAAFERLVADPTLTERLRVGAMNTGRQWSLTRCVDQLEALLLEVAGRSAPERAVRT